MSRPVFTPAECSITELALVLFLWVLASAFWRSEGGERRGIYQRLTSGAIDDFLMDDEAVGSTSVLAAGILEASGGAWLCTTVLLHRAMVEQRLARERWA